MKNKLINTTEPWKSSRIRGYRKQVGYRDKNTGKVKICYVEKLNQSDDRECFLYF